MNFRLKNSLSTGALLSAAAIGLTLASSAALAADPMTTATGGNLASGDRTFVEKAAIGGMTEVEASKVAQTKSTNPAVKDYAAKMIADHTKAGGELTTIATSKSVTPPGTLDKSHKSEVDKLSEKSGPDFDKAYAKAMVSDHKATVSLFEKEAKSGKDGDLKQFASTTLPTLQGHLQMAQTLQDGVK